LSNYELHLSDNSAYEPKQLTINKIMRNQGLKQGI